MILRRILLENFGLYAGSNELELTPRRRNGRTAPIIVIGGKNGAGKTTLLEAVRLSLYGRQALGSRVSQSEYDDYLRRRIYHDGSTHSAAVGVEFDYAEAGTTHRYTVRREWAARGKAVVESLLVEKDGLMVESVPREEWHQFLQELIPPGVSQLFFFDGEKIAEIANGADDGLQLAEAVRGLLGIELVSRLRTDLGLFLARQQRADTDPSAGQLEAVIRDIAALEETSFQLTGVIAELISARDSQARAAEQIRRRFVSEGGDAAMQRHRIEAERIDVERRIESIEQEFRELAGQLLPFLLAPRVLSQFRAALASASASTPRSASMHFRTAITRWRRERVPKRKAKWSSQHWADLAEFTKSAESKQRTASPELAALKELGDGAAALARLTEAETVTRPRAVALREELDGLAARLASLDVALERANNAAAGYLLDELRLAEQRVGGTETLLHARQEELKTVHGRRVTLDRERHRLLEQQSQATSGGNRADLASRSARALADYERRLLGQKIKQLQAEFVRLFNFVARKSDLIADIRIDPDTLSTELLDTRGRSLQKSSLSAGEQQVYAVSLLWALARTSGRPLPMIVDTPLGRLDSEHRSNLLNRYFPSASHQVILLSTDTEIDQDLLAGLGETVSHTYRLEYQASENRTVIVPGYFDSKSVRTERLRAV